MLLVLIKLQQSASENKKTIQIQSGGPQPITLTPVTVARKESQNVSKRTLIARTKQTKEVMKLISGSSAEAQNARPLHERRFKKNSNTPSPYPQIMLQP